MISKPINAFVLAAGLGERLRPITNHLPKPLLPLLGKPVIEGIVERLSKISSGKIGINLHYKADMLRDWARNSPYSDRIQFFYEDPILGTGGALKNAEAFLSEGQFLVHNSDIVSEIDLFFLLETHLSEGNIATLATVHFPGCNNVILNEEGLVMGIKHLEDYDKGVTFTGIAVYSPEFLRFLTDGISHVTDAWLRAIEAGHRVRSLDFTGTYWRDLGTPESYASAIIDALRNEGEMVYIHPSVDVPDGIEIEGYVAIEKGCVIKPASHFKNCIILEGTRLDRLRYENSIIGPDLEIGLEEGLLTIRTGGSERWYRRIKDKQGRSVVTVHYPSEDPDFKRHIEYTRFFMSRNISVPELIDYDLNKRSAVFEDLGDMSLYNWLKLNRDRERIELMYRKVIDIAVSIHYNLMDHLTECPLLRERVFDFDYFRWETGYFIESFVRTFCEKVYKDFSASQGGSFERIVKSFSDELDRLAQMADSYPKTVIHRDFQCQNIMVKDDQPRIIDYQGARIGPPAYDIASILWDPYYRMDDRLRESLLKYYISRMSECLEGFDPEDFLESLLPCRMQRHMQALGAYGFLSTAKGKGYFLKFVPEALRLLKEECDIVREKYPTLFDLISKITANRR